MTYSRCGHPAQFGTGDMATCANPRCAVWLTPDPLLETPLARLLRAVEVRGGVWVNLRGVRRGVLEEQETI